MKKLRKVIPEAISTKTWLSDSFYEKSKNIALIDGTTPIPSSWVTIHFKTYPRLEHIQVYKSKTKKIKSLLMRRSVRSFSGLGISFRLFSSLLYNAAGITRESENINYSRRSYPSAGARYPLEVYIVAQSIKGLKEGVYHYNVKDNQLEILLLEKMGEYILDITGGEKWLLKANFLIVITGVPDRSRLKYGERGYRYMLIEAGHLAQNFCLIAEAGGLATCPTGGFIESKTISLLDIGNVNEFPLYLIAVGKNNE